MGYVSHVEGTIYVSGVENDDFVAEVETEYFVYEATNTFVSFDGTGKAYDMEEVIQNTINAIAQAGGTANGTVYRGGEGVGDIQRYVVKNNVIVNTEKAVISFSDGEKFDPWM